MTDEEILKRLAEIEKPFEGNPDDYFWCRTCNEFKAWNPLDNWSDLGPLIEKYRPEMIPMELGGWQIDLGAGGEIVWNESLPHAICLAIIEAHK